MSNIIYIQYTTRPKSVLPFSFASFSLPPTVTERMSTSLQRPGLCNEQQWAEMTEQQQRMMVEFARKMTGAPMSRPHDPNVDRPHGRPYEAPGQQNIDPNLKDV
jgi:hypothetical protein